MRNWGDKITSIQTESDFNALTIEAFNYQYQHIPVYQNYCKQINTSIASVKQYDQIPFLPIDFFKSHTVCSPNTEHSFTFTSSGTTGNKTSRHFISNIKLYERSFLEAFSIFYGSIKDYCILALLPSYLERTGSSLVYMANTLIKLSSHVDSGFYLDNYQELSQKLKILNKQNQKIILLGVSYALLDMAEQFPLKLNNTIIMETGGMKGRRKELIREDLHSTLCNAFGLTQIHSEYGMTELLSQAYSKGHGTFETPPWMKILIRDTYDPFSFYSHNRSGGINVIDLANINSCCFIETKDLGKTFSPTSFTILGRFDNSDIRGCNLLIQ